VKFELVTNPNKDDTLAEIQDALARCARSMMLAAVCIPPLGLTGCGGPMPREQFYKLRQEATDYQKALIKLVENQGESRESLTKMQRELKLIAESPQWNRVRVLASDEMYYGGSNFTAVESFGKLQAAVDEAIGNGSKLDQKTKRVCLQNMRVGTYDPTTFYFPDDR
jgi:hypothetical protein